MTQKNTEQISEQQRGLVCPPLWLRTFPGALYPPGGRGEATAPSRMPLLRSADYHV